MKLASMSSLFLGIALTACLSSVATQKTGARQAARPPDCAFEVFTSVHSGYTEIGTLDVMSGLWEKNPLYGLDQFKERIQESVCAAGGDAVLAHVGEGGYYRTATVLKRDQPQAPRDDGGCRYDTQCKGDRICVAGECVAPPAPTNPTSPSDSAPASTRK